MALSAGSRLAVDRGKAMFQALWRAPQTGFSNMFGITTRAGSAAAGAATAGRSVLDRAVGLASNAFRPVTFIADKLPTIATLGAIGGAGYMAKGYFDGKRERAVNEMAAREQMSYLNSVDPETFARLQDRMRGAQPGQPGFAAKIAADREAAAAMAAKQ